MLINKSYRLGDNPTLAQLNAEHKLEKRTISSVIVQLFAQKKLRLQSCNRSQILTSHQTIYLVIQNADYVTVSHRT
jgi:hypothetical protein